MATRPKAVQLRHSKPLRRKQRKVGGRRKLGRLPVLGGSVPNNRRRNVGIPEIDIPDREYPASDYQLKYET